jgi:hypothetical protein
MLRKSLLILTALASLTIANVKAEIPYPFNKLLTDHATCVLIVRKFLENRPYVTLADCSLFVEKKFGEREYLVAKFSANTLAGVQVVGMVYDLSNDWLCAIDLKAYTQFLKTGDKNLLVAQPDLDPNS